ncbi:unnamed protein product [Prorocentrum cordatum]|uniref:Uncharacterized protein n=1 Tax=Prorocentrum cordatum TaxID=2364126 RepID=A0ABN9R147_9DINO|nr:unnamed protein product [Polarella glacialis]
MASYLGQRPQLELFSESHRMSKGIVAEVDSDWASEPGRGSVDGGVLFIGSHRIDSWSGQQGNRALSIAGAEFKGAVNVSARGIWLKNLLLETGIDMMLQVNTGSSGAQGVASRLGRGKVRHLETKYLWAQEKIGGETTSMAKTRADVNRADMQTKSLEEPKFMTLLERLRPGIYHGQLKAQMIVDLLLGAGRR